MFPASCFSTTRSTAYMMLRLVCLVLFALCLAGPAQAQTTQPATVAKPAKNAPSKPAPASRSTPQAAGPCVGVISLLGDRFIVKKVGVTVFGNENKEVPVDGFGLDDLVVERVRAAVGSGFVVRRIAADKSAFSSYDPGLGMFVRGDKAGAIVRQVAGQAGCKRYVVVIKGIRQGGFFGIGVMKGSPLYNMADIYAVIRIYVHDGQSFDILKSGEGSISGSNFMTGPPTLRIDWAQWPEPPEAANNPVMRASTRQLLGNVLDKSLPALLQSQ
ncbi:hypothetical protein QRQ56_36485 [Bradyrhizobium sp. U531]|uniref:hypothetical protein n=1 Tax=Bradyrhizobium sp. U531 TaxID=3053458 RepID=UPI003F43276D